MSYRCEVCRGTQPPGQTRLVYRILRPDGSILRELPVCRLCRTLLGRGTPLSQLAAPHHAPPPAVLELGHPHLYGEEFGDESPPISA